MRGWDAKPVGNGSHNGQKIWFYFFKKSQEYYLFNSKGY
jgi:hypothetical protein